MNAEHDLAAVPPPGTATRLFLRACERRRMRDIDWSAAPARYTRYPAAAGIALDDSGWVGTLLLGLLGLTRISWMRPHDETGRPRPGRSHIVVGRPAPSGGALYPIEAYTATAEALCHYDTVHHGLEVVRHGDYRGRLAALLSRPLGQQAPQLLLALTAVFWRSGFKYGEFAYRLLCQETGILAAQAFALSEMLGLDAEVHLSFDGDGADRLLAVDPAAEGCLALVAFSTRIGRPIPSEARCADALVAPAASVADPAAPVTSRLPHLAALHAASRRMPRLSQRGPTRDSPAPVPPAPAGGNVTELPSVTPVPAAEGIGARQSPLAGYRPEPIAVESLARILLTSTGGYRGDLPGAPQGLAATAPFVLVFNATGLPSGVYRYLPDQRTLAHIGDEATLTDAVCGPLQPNTRSALRTCAAALIPVGDPLAGVGSFGDQWYRFQQAEVGLVLHRAALAAAALGLASRIHSDGTNPATDAALGLRGTPWRSLSFLLIGARRTSGPARTVPASPEASRLWRSTSGIPG
jgi:SagB-type dehydrogenase family enzyme